MTSVEKVFKVFEYMIYEEPVKSFSEKIVSDANLVKGLSLEIE